MTRDEAINAGALVQQLSDLEALRDELKSDISRGSAMTGTLEVVDPQGGLRVIKIPTLSPEMTAAMFTAAITLVQENLDKLNAALNNFAVTPPSA